LQSETGAKYAEVIPAAIAGNLPRGQRKKWGESGVKSADRGRLGVLLAAGPPATALYGYRPLRFEKQSKEIKLGAMAKIPKNSHWGLC
jgi:hypothetical protein